MIVYHGTSTDPSIIWNEGLRPHNYQELSKKMIYEAGRKLPKWVLKAIEREVEYQGNWWNKGPLVHLTLSKSNALDYAKSDGGEFVSIVRNYINKGLRRKPKLIQSRKFIVTIVIPETSEVKEVKQRVSKFGYNWEEFKENTTWDITVPRVYPRDIISIEEII